MQRHFRILHVEVSLSGPRDIVEPIAFAYRRFETRAAGPEALCLETDASSLRIAGRDVPLLGGVDPTRQLYEHFRTGLMDRIASHAVLHAAALVDPQGGALLLAAPSGHGKSSLTLELAARGLGFLGDDFAPLDLATGRVDPYPRAVGVHPDGTAPIPDPFRSAASRPETPRLFGKCLLDVGQVLGERFLATEPAPLRHVILLAASDGQGGVLPATWVRLAGRPEHAAGLDAALRACPGVEVVERDDGPSLCTWQVRLDHAHGPTLALSRILEGDRVLFSEKRSELRPDFTSRTGWSRISRREAAEFLGRELLNRRTKGKLLEAFGGSVTALFLALAGTLKEAACSRVRVGQWKETADLILRLASTSAG